MPILKLLRLTKHYGANTAGEIASFNPDTAAHIVKNQGGELIGDFDPAKHVVVQRDGKAFIVEAKPEIGPDNKPTGNLVPKQQPTPPKNGDDGDKK